jgi:uncharacterized membrane protein YcaP (DUF421 family)
MHLLAAPWKELLLGEEDWSFLGWILLRSAVMFLVALFSIRIIGKRGVMQGVFEIVLIITLGSAAGDPMFYSKVGLLPAILTFATVVSMYKFVNFFTMKNATVEHIVEGDQLELVENGRFVFKNYKKATLGKEELMSDLRMRGVSQLGQIKYAYVEPSGDLSVFFFPDSEVKHGLPILPQDIRKGKKEITKSGTYSCTFCGFTREFEPVSEFKCPECSQLEWVGSTNEKRVH